jgi:hypothetical protein
VADEVAHRGRIGGVSSLGLLIDEPSVEAIVFGDFDQLVRSRIGVADLGEKILHPGVVAAENERREKDRAEDGHTVAVGVVDHLAGGGHDVDRADATPIDRLFQILPVGESIDRAGASLRPVAGVGVECLHAALADPRIGIGFEPGGHVDAASQGHCGHVERRIGIRGGIPVQELGDRENRLHGHGGHHRTRSQPFHAHRITLRREIRSAEIFRKELHLTHGPEEVAARIVDAAKHERQGAREVSLGNGGGDFGLVERIPDRQQAGGCMIVQGDDHRVSAGHLPVGIRPQDDTAAHIGHDPSHGVQAQAESAGVVDRGHADQVVRLAARVELIHPHGQQDRKSRVRGGCAGEIQQACRVRHIQKLEGIRRRAELQPGRPRWKQIRSRISHTAGACRGMVGIAGLIRPGADHIRGVFADAGGIRGRQMLKQGGMG